MNAGVACSRSRTVSRAGVLGRCPVDEEFPLVAALTAARRGSKRR